MFAYCVGYMVYLCASTTTVLCNFSSSFPHPILGGSVPLWGGRHKYRGVSVWRGGAGSTSLSHPLFSSNRISHRWGHHYIISQLKHWNIPKLKHWNCMIFTLCSYTLLSPSLLFYLPVWQMERTICQSMWEWCSQWVFLSPRRSAIPSLWSMTTLLRRRRSSTLQLSPHHRGLPSEHPMSPMLSLRTLTVRTNTTAEYTKLVEPTILCCVGQLYVVCVPVALHHSL